MDFSIVIVVSQFLPAFQFQHPRSGAQIESPNFWRKFGHKYPTPRSQNGRAALIFATSVSRISGRIFAKCFGSQFGHHSAGAEMED